MAKGDHTRCVSSSMHRTASICVVDDDLSTLKALGRMLRSHDFEDVATFTEPAAFLAAVAGSACRVAILDIAMPLMNGLEVQARLHQISPDTRVIFFTGQSDPAIREKALKNGAIAFVSKLADEDKLIEAVRRGLARTCKHLPISGDIQAGAR